MENLFNSSVITCDKVIDTSRTASSDSIKKKRNTNWIIRFLQFFIC